MLVVCASRAHPHFGGAHQKFLDRNFLCSQTACACRSPFKQGTTHDHKLLTVICRISALCQTCALRLSERNPSDEPSRRCRSLHRPRNTRSHHFVCELPDEQSTMEDAGNCTAETPRNCDPQQEANSGKESQSSQSCLRSNRRVGSWPKHAPSCLRIDNSGSRPGP